MSRGFTLIELMISLLLASFVVMGIGTYLKNSSKTLRTSDEQTSVDQSAMAMQTFLNEDLKQVVFLNPSCDTNPMNTAAVVDCDLIPFRGSITPLPGTTEADVTLMTSYLPPANLTDNPSTLTDDNDSVRLVLFDFDESFDCKFDRNVATNPDAASEKIYLETACEPQISLGKLLLVVESSGTSVFSNLIQVTGITNTGSELEVTHVSAGNSFNQPGTLANSGFSNAARVFPVMIVEYAKNSTGNGLMRRETNPEDGDLSGLGTWTSIDPLVESIQFYPLTASVSSVIEHQRTMQYTADAFHDGLEDIRGVSPRVVIRSAQELEIEVSYDNPITSSIEYDNYQRKEVKFFVASANFTE